jgi:glutamate formiminotransferase
MGTVLACVVNVSEGRREDVVTALARAGEPDLLDVHRDPHHHRAVLTLVGEAAPRRVAALAVDRLDLRGHDGVHPRLGVVDVVPFVPLAAADLADAVAARDRFAAWMAAELHVPCFLYGPERTLPEIRRRAWVDLVPDTDGPDPHPTAGATCVGARTALVAFNLWVTADLGSARRVAAAVRGPAVRALGLQVGERVQVSVNLVAPDELGPAEIYDRVATMVAVEGCELVGLVPERILARTDPARWAELDLAADRTFEARIERTRTSGA